MNFSAKIFGKVSKILQFSKHIGVYLFYFSRISVTKNNKTSKKNATMVVKIPNFGANRELYIRYVSSRDAFR